MANPRKPPKPEKKRKRGRPRVHGERTSFLLRLTPELHEVLRYVAAKEGESLNGVMVRILEEWWSTQPDRRAVERLLRSSRDVV